MMAKNKNTMPAKDSGDTQKNIPQNSEKKVDIASIDASAAGASGEFVRDGGKGVYREDDPKQKTDTENFVPKDSPKKSEYTIPVLRTYHHDTRNIAQTKGGAELRTILAKEAEEKRIAQEEYIRNTKDIMKESAVLRDKYRNFTKKQHGKDVSKSTPSTTGTDTDVQSINRKNITHTLSGATAYMQSVNSNADQRETSSFQHASKKNTTPSSERPSSSVSIDVPNKKTKNISEESGDRRTEKKGIFARIRGRALPKDAFTQQERELLQNKQQEIVEKQSIQDAWKDFKQKKETIQQRGLEARDVRSYSATPDQQTSNKAYNRQNILLLIIVFFLLVGLIFFVVFLAVSPTERLITRSDINETSAVPDVINSEHQVFVNMSDETASDIWQSITEGGGGQDTVTKFVPYESVGEKDLQLSFQGFSSAFSLRIPIGLQTAFDDYYFVGKYTTQIGTNGIFIASIKKYGDAFVWMRNWEKNAINSFSSIFPSFFQQSKTVNITVEPRIIDNQDVRVIQNHSSQKDLIYYFFGRSILVFIAGDESIIPLINARIRSMNTF